MTRDGTLNIVRSAIVMLPFVCACGTAPSNVGDAGGDAGADVVVDVQVGPVVLLDASYPFGIAVDDQYVYYTSSVDGTLSRLPKNGGDPVVIATGMNGPYRLALDDAAAYVAVIGTTDSYVDGEIVRVAK